MSLVRYIHGRTVDLAECFECTRDLYAYDARDRLDVLDLWAHLIRAGAGLCPMIEDTSRSPGTRILFMSFTAFVTDACLRELRTSSRPFWGRYFLDAWRTGKRVFLTLPEIQAANSGEGVNMICLHSGSRQQIYRRENYQEILSRIVDYQYWAHGGYRLKCWFAEMYQRIQHQWVLGYGLVLWRDYQDYYALHPDERPTDLDRRPCIYGCTAADAEERTGMTVSKLFVDIRPKLFLKRSDQELLLCALSMDTDEEIAQYLAISKPTVRKRWQSIYDVVMATPEVRSVLPGFLKSSASAAAPDASAKRGAERKRQLINYFRHHMEELRPIVGLGAKPTLRYERHADRVQADGLARLPIREDK